MSSTATEAALSNEPCVKEIARELGLEDGSECARFITRHAVERVESFAREFTVSSLGNLLRLAAMHLDVSIELVGTDDEVSSVAERYGEANPMLKALIEEDIRGETEGLLLKNPLHASQKGTRRFLAVIDVRGKKRSRAYFTIWHELAHLLTRPPEETGYAPKRRSPSGKEKQADPEERLVDRIASRLAFYRPLFEPALRRATSGQGGVLTLAAIEEAAEEAFARRMKASLWAAARASLRIVRRPVCLVEVAPILKKSRERRAKKADGDLFGYEPEKELRVRQCLRNAEARNSKLEIRRRMRVPEQSLLSRMHDGQSGSPHSLAKENQDWWDTSAEGVLSPMPMRVSAVRRGDYTYGLLVPLCW